MSTIAESFIQPPLLAEYSVFSTQCIDICLHLILILIELEVRIKLLMTMDSLNRVYGQNVDLHIQLCYLPVLQC